MVTEQPNVKENGRYSITQAVKVLGISRGTMYKAIALGARCGGIDVEFIGKHNLRIIIFYICEVFQHSDFVETLLKHL